MLTTVKTALRIKTSAYDSELNLLISAAAKDLGVAGVITNSTASQNDDLVKRAIITYCKMNFGTPTDYDKLKASYDEQKAQMSMASGYTNWGDDSDV